MKHIFFGFKKAFTLLELLVVIGIIGILVGIGTSSYATAQKKARDAKRKADVKEIQDAYEQYYSVCNFAYPTPGTTSVWCPSPTMMIMPTVPVDPKTNTSYTITSDGKTYTICPSLETETVSYCLSNQQ